MNNKELAEIIIKAVVAVLMALITRYVVPWVKSKVSDVKLREVQKYAEIAVRAAEQAFSNDEWREKKEYALRYVSEKVTSIGISLTAEDINSIIESTVNYVKYGTEYTKSEG